MMDEKTETAGIQAEHRWVQANFPGWHWEMQSVVDHGGHVYDVIEISRGGERREIYFDISNWFGHLS
jgi:hypothetical protein